MNFKFCPKCGFKLEPTQQDIKTPQEKTDVLTKTNKDKDYYKKKPKNIILIMDYLITKLLKKKNSMKN